MGITPWLIYKSSTYGGLQGTHAKFQLIAKIPFLKEEIDSGEGKQAFFFPPLLLEESTYNIDYIF